MKVEIKKLEEVCVVLLRNLEEMGVGEIEINEDFYWTIDEEKLYEIYSEPKDLKLGSLVDEWGWLQKMAEDPDDAIVYALVWLGAVLRAVAIQHSNRTS